MFTCHNFAWQVNVSLWHIIHPSFINRPRIFFLLTWQIFIWEVALWNWNLTLWIGIQMYAPLYYDVRGKSKVENDQVVNTCNCQYILRNLNIVVEIKQISISCPFESNKALHRFNFNYIRLSLRGYRISSNATFLLVFSGWLRCDYKGSGRIHDWTRMCWNETFTKEATQRLVIQNIDQFRIMWYFLDTGAIGDEENPREIHFIL